MVDPNTAAYRLMPTGLTQTAILSPMAKPDEKRKVNVKNTAFSYDEMVVDGWIWLDGDQKYFEFEDGELGHTVVLDFEDVKRKMLDKN